MATHDASVKKALPSQKDLQDHAEHCSLDPELLTTVSCAIGQQVRIKRNAAEYALFTISERHPEQPGDVARVGLAGRRRLGTDDEFDGELDTQVPHPTLPEDEAEAASELIEQLADDGRHQGLIVIAPHGGAIERHTDDQAERVATRLAAKAVSAWRCKGWKRDGGAFDRWHITSTDINEASFPRLRAVIGRRFTYAVAFHGFDDPLILIGGGAPLALKEEIREAIAAAVAGCDIDVRIATADDGFGGDDERNIVNRLTAGGTGGVQIEQSLAAREQHWEAIADAVADVYDRKLQARPRPWPDAIGAFLGGLRKVLGRLVTRLGRRRGGG